MARRSCAGDPPGSIGEALGRASNRLAEAGVAEPRWEAAYLLGHLLGRDRGGLLVRRRDPLPAGAEGCLFDWVERRALHEPLQYLTGEQEFRGLAFRVDSRVLVPRPETEDAVSAVLAQLPEGGGRVLDIGTGSGCIAVSLAVARADLDLTAIDLSPDALELAAENAARHGVETRIRFMCCDFAAEHPNLRGPFDVIVGNPPYIAESDWQGLEREVRDFEPRAALVAGPSGVEAYLALVPRARALLAEGGTLVVEIGFGQLERVRAILEDSSFGVCAVRRDLRGIPRIIVAARTGSEGRA